MDKQKTKRMGRPPGSEFPHLIHVRISEEMMAGVQEMAGKRMDSPTMAQLVREALAMLLSTDKRGRR